MSDVTVTNDHPAANTPEARTSDGTLISPAPSGTPTPSSQTQTGDSTEGQSFLTGKRPEAEPQKAAEGSQIQTAASTAPEKYNDFTLPDGYEFDQAELGKATTVFKELGLSQDAAQRLVSLYAENGLQAAQAPFEYWAQMQKDWNAEIASRFPGEASNRVRADINSAIDTVLPPSLARNFKAALDLTGAGTHPDMVEGLSILLRPLYEGKPVVGGRPSEAGQKAPGQAPMSIAEAMYPHLAKNRPQ